MESQVIVLRDLNKQASMEFILSIKYNKKMFEYPEENCKIKWTLLVSKCAPKSTQSLLK